MQSIIGGLNASLVLTLRRVARDAAVIVIAIISVGRAFGLFGEGVDFYAYWSADLGTLYDGARSYGPGYPFLYSPLFAQLTEPLRWLPFEVALGLWTVLELGCLLWLAGPWTLPLMLALAPEWMNGNVHLVMAAAVVLSFREAGFWLVPTMTKLGPGIGVLWHLFRGEWGHVIRAGAVIAIAFGVSFLAAPDLWFGWANLLLSDAGSMPPPGSMQIPLVLRVMVALVLLAWAARTARRWPVPIAVAFGLPVLWWAGLMAMGVAAYRLARRRVGDDLAVQVGREAPAYHLPYYYLMGFLELCRRAELLDNEDDRVVRGSRRGVTQASLET